MDFFRIDGRTGPNILRLDFIFHIYIVNIANCILIKKIHRYKNLVNMFLTHAHNNALITEYYGS